VRAYYISDKLVMTFDRMLLDFPLRIHSQCIVVSGHQHILLLFVTHGS